MRLLEIKQLITESRSVAGGIIDVPARAEFFFNSIEKGIPFPIEGTAKDPNPEPIIVKKSQLPELRRAYQAGYMEDIVLQATDGRLVKLNKLIKTKGLGTKGAEKIPVKPTDVFKQEKVDVETSEDLITQLGKAGAFPLRDLNNKIQTNAALAKAGNIGKAIKEIAKQISAKKVPTMPSYLTPDEKKAIELYAGEYLGILSLYNGTAEFAKKDQFYEFIGRDLGDLLLYFPRNVSNPLADSYGIENTDNGHRLRISSKAAGPGAAPALVGLKVPDHVRKNKKFVKEIAFLDEALDDKYSAVTQPFGLMNWLFEHSPDALDERFYPYLPWTQEWLDEIVQGVKPKLGITFPKEAMNDMISILPQGRPKGTDAGVIWAAVTYGVVSAVNSKNALPEFRAVVLETLGYNFIQLYSILKGDKLVARAFWPAKIDGKVRLKSKAYAAKPDAKLSFQITK